MKSTPALLGFHTDFIYLVFRSENATSFSPVYTVPFSIKKERELWCTHWTMKMILTPEKHGAIIATVFKKVHFHFTPFSSVFLLRFFIVLQCERVRKLPVFVRK